MRVARVTLPDTSVTHTVVDDDGLPLEPVEEFLAFLRDGGASPNTVKAYAHGLCAWWHYLRDQHHGWEDFPLSAVGGFLAYLRTGDLPSVSRVGPPPSWLSPSSQSQRLAAVYSFYDWAQAAHGVETGHLRLRAGARRARYAPMLSGVGARPVEGRRAVKVRRDFTRPPVLTPAQVETVLDLAGRPWGRPPTPEQTARAARDRLLFALLAETGLRLGEALSLRHVDWHVGAGDTPAIEVVPRQDHPHGARVKNGNHRRVYISDALEGAYSAYVWALVDLGIDVDVPDLSAHFVFVNVAHAPMWAAMRPESVYRVTASITRRAGGVLPLKWSPHWLRHTHATALLLSGCPPHVVMRRLGHADIQTTLSTYGWVTEDAQMRSLADWHRFTAGWRDLA